MDKTELMKHLWDIIEKIPKVIKDFSKNPAADAYKKFLWDELTMKQMELRHLERLEPDTFYRRVNYDKHWLIGQLKEFIIGNAESSIEGRPVAVFKTLASDVTDFSYTKIADIMYIDLGKCDSDFKPIKIQPEEFATYVGNTFCGKLLEEILKGAA